VEPVKIPIADSLDLHTFLPREIADLLEDYFAECLKAGLCSVRIIHGKGKGIQKRRVQGLLPHLKMRLRKPAGGGQHWLN